jgi:hypothetical protein
MMSESDPQGEARVIQAYMGSENMSVQGVAEVLGRSEAWVRERLALLDDDEQATPSDPLEQVRHAPISLSAGGVSVQIYLAPVGEEPPIILVNTAAYYGPKDAFTVVVNGKHVHVPEQNAAFSNPETTSGVTEPDDAKHVHVLEENVFPLPSFDPNAVLGKFNGRE